MRHLSGLLLALAMTTAATAADVTISGEATYRERMLLPSGAQLEVRLEDQSRADAPATVIASFDGPATTSPTAFEVTFDSAVIQPGHRYGWRASIRHEGNLMFTSDTFMAFDPAQTTGVSLPMVRVAEADEPLSLTGAWLAEDIEGGGVIDNAQTTIEFHEETVSGRGGCNSYRGPAKVAGNKLAFGSLVTTQMACAPALMDQENKFYAALANARTFEIDNVQRKLILRDEAGKPIIVLSRMD